MRRLLPIHWPRAKSFLFHSGQTAGLVVAAGLAMAAAPQAAPVDPPVEGRADAAPSAPPLPAEAEPLGPPIQIMRFLKPVEGHAVNSDFGPRRLAGAAEARSHEGVDIAAPQGTAIRATAPGRVVRVGYEAGGYGRFVEVRHPNGLTSFYAHMSRVQVRRGQRLAAGDRLGRVGSTGYSTGPHLHFEIRRRGAPLNPARYLDREFAFRAPAEPLPTARG